MQTELRVLNNKKNRHKSFLFKDTTFSQTEGLHI